MEHLGSSIHISSIAVHRIGSADLDLQVTVVAPTDKAFYLTPHNAYYMSLNRHGSKSQFDWCAEAYTCKAVDLDVSGSVA